MSEPPPNTGGLTRRRPAHGLLPDELKAEIVKARRAMTSFDKIGKALGISAPYAHELYWKAMAEVKAPAVTELRAEQNRNLDAALELAWEIANRDHVATSGGTIVYAPAAEGETPVPLRDDMPKLRALAEVRALEETRTKLNGTAAPAQVQINGAIKYDFVGIDLEALT